MNDKSIRIGLMLGLLGAFLGSLMASAGLLPDRVATHFNASGQADGWMTKLEHLTFMSVFGIAFPLFLMGIFWGTRFLPIGAINIPHREYWLSDTRRGESLSFLAWHGVWLVCMMEVLLIALHWMVVYCNRQSPPELPASWGLGLVIPFLIGVGIWIRKLYVRFAKPPMGETSGSQLQPFTA